MNKINMVKERKIRDLSHVCFKNENERVLMQDKEIFNRCREYLSKPLNETHAYQVNLKEDMGQRERCNSFHWRIRAKKVSEILRTTMLRKALGLDDIPFDV